MHTAEGVAGEPGDAVLPLGNAEDVTCAEGLVTTPAMEVAPQPASTSVTVNAAAVAPNLDHMLIKRGRVDLGYELGFDHRLDARRRLLDD